jgi:glycosyltransferase involved in cell wall biosynthesis
VRVALITNLAPHYRRPLYERLASRHTVDFYFFASEGERYFSSDLSHQGGELPIVDLPRYRVLGEPLMPGLARTLRRDRYDVVVKCLNGKLMVPSTVAIAKARGLPLVMWTGMWHHPETAVHRLTRPLTESVYRSADAILAYGDHVKRFLTAVPGVDAGKVFVAGQAVEPQRFLAVAHEPVDPPEFVYVGQFEQRKGLDVLLAAFGRLPAGSARLALVGSGSLEEELRAQTAHNDDVEVVGYVPQERLPERLARALALVVPSVTTRLDKEPWGLVVNEAMHAGLPVVASDAVGAAAGGLVVDGRNGRIVPERDPLALASALTALIEDPDGARRMGATARQDVERFSYEAMVGAFDAAMLHAVAKRNGSRS